MKNIILLSSLVVVLASCSWGKQNTPTPTVNYPSTQSGTPATAYCESQGGTVSIEQSGTLDVAYCTTKTGEKVDAWKYMSDMTSLTGATATGETN